MKISNFWEKLKNYVFRGLRRLGVFNKMSDEEFINMLYKMRMKQEVNLENPMLFSEKLQWLKLYNRRSEYTTMVDKNEVKDYVASVLGSKYIIPTIGVWDNFDEIDFEKLPNQFVLKCTHDSGGLVICKDKSNLNKEKARKKIERCLKRNYYFNSREWPYKNVSPKIIAEEYLENSENGLNDYKIWCFNGEPIYIQFISGRMGDTTYEGFYDTNWQLQPFSYYNPKMDKMVTKPKCLDEMLHISKIIAKDQPFVRCDFYVLEDGSIRFGEITFYPMSGMQQWNPVEMDRILGDKIDLSYGR